MGVNEQSAFNALVEKYYKEMQEIQSNRSITESVRDNKIDALQRKYQDQFSYFGTSILCNAGEELGEDDGLLDSDPVPLTSELREFIQRYTQKLKQINVIKESTIHRSCIVCGETIKGLGLTDMSDAGVSVCWNCSDEHAYMDHGIALIDYI